MECFRHPTIVGKSDRKVLFKLRTDPSITCQCLILGGAVARGRLGIQCNVVGKHVALSHLFDELLNLQLSS